MELMDMYKVLIDVRFVIDVLVLVGGAIFAIFGYAIVEMHKRRKGLDDRIKYIEDLLEFYIQQNERK